LILQRLGWCLGGADGTRVARWFCSVAEQISGGSRHAADQAVQLDERDDFGESSLHQSKKANHASLDVW